MPELQATPTPGPVLPMFETTLVGDLKLESGYKLIASTQIFGAFNVFAEGLDWEYPAVLPSDCCNFKQVSALTGLGTVLNANTNLNGSGTIVSVFTAGSTTNGTLVKRITIKALQSTSINGMIRVFLSANGGTNFYLIREIPIPQTSQSAYDPSYKQVLELNYNLQADYIIGLSTQNAEAFGITIEGEEWSYPI
ncbi:MAG: hypothetical protein K9G49_16065 [Taibaiella sp.]|nr:hypothetical protein [Taibaiella sp.]